MRRGRSLERCWRPPWSRGGATGLASGAGSSDAARLASVPAVALAVVPRAQQGDGRRLVRHRRLLRARPDLPASRGRRDRRRVVGAARAGFRSAGAGGGTGRRVARVLVVAATAAGQRRCGPGLARRRGVAVVRVLPGPSLPDPLHGAAGRRQCRAGRAWRSAGSPAGAAAVATLLLCGVWWTTRPFDPEGRDGARSAVGPAQEPRATRGHRLPAHARAATRS